ncbi:hypothetical protein [Defluviitalea phaphyphila]|uniref:hypothetical protein n=1 Tax=Defluviitalea phaphyphila TaxID=1473580 RepID=UPI0007305B3B|nr:hypothetical protein [Defluviitalea phaphyphila]
MIYRADFKIKNLNVSLISPTIFGNIAKVLYEIFDEKKAEELIEYMISSNLLISDMLLKNEFPYFKFENNIFDFQEGNLKEKREAYREWKKYQKEKYNLKEIPNTRIRIRIDRKNGCAQDSYLFYQDEKRYSQDNTYSIFIYTEKQKVLELLELVFNILEKTGVGTDISIGMGEIKFIKKDEKIFIKDEKMYKRYIDDTNPKFSISSTIITEECLRDYKFLKYKVNRYDGRSLSFIKPVYYIFEKGSKIEKKRGNGTYIHTIKNGTKKIHIYNCVFPISFREEEMR